MSLIKEFKEFIARGNVIDLAVGVVIGAAFGKIVSSLVSDVVMPPISILTAKVSFENLYIPLNEAAAKAADLATAQKAGIIAYGLFLNNVIQFLIVAACIFLVVKAVNRLKREQAAAPPPPAPPTKTEVLLEEIRDALKNK
ncbi:MAG TPA: large-conductance mechanosensitive channel protein MscL [Chthoniobacterales bacterium]|jgi:large conductance mechanosensitive channel